MTSHPARDVRTVARPPERLPLHDGCALRRHREDDLDALVAAIEESRDHLRPWMPWASEPAGPATTGVFLATSVELWDRGVDFGFAVVGPDDQIVGGCGLHARLGAGALEIGYWVHVAWTRRGLARAATAALTRAGLAMDGVDRIVVRHDAANRASAAVPRSLGFRCDGTDVPEDGPTAGRPTTWWSTTVPV